MIKFKELQEKQFFRFKDERQIRIVAAQIDGKYYCPVIAKKIQGPITFEAKGPNTFPRKLNKNVLLLSNRSYFTYSVGQHKFKVTVRNPEDQRDFFSQLNTNEKVKFDVEETEFIDADQYVVQSSDGSREIGIMLHLGPKSILELGK